MAEETQTTAAECTKNKAVENQNYCWSHGFDVGPDHKSGLCGIRAQVYMTCTMHNNIMGGCRR